MLHCCVALCFVLLRRLLYRSYVLCIGQYPLTHSKHSSKTLPSQNIVLLSTPQFSKWNINKSILYKIWFLIHTSGSTTFTSSQCELCSAYFPRNRTSSAHLTYICPSLFECAGNTFFYIFVILKILNLSKTLRTPNLYYVIYGRPLMVV